jgi:hypothetical protein
VAAHDTEFSARYPALWEWLTLSIVDGRPVETATCTLFAEEGMLKACICDRDGDRSFFRAATTFLGLLEALEGALASGSADWRPRKRPSSPSTRR